MASWVTHLMIADMVMKQCSKLDRRGFCVGNIAPDCNVENKDWTSFTPSRLLPCGEFVVENFYREK